MNYYERHIGDYIKDTVSLSMLEDGAYNRLIDQIYATEKLLSLDRKEIYRLARAGSLTERKAVDYVLDKFFDKTENGYAQKRIQSEIARYQDKQRKAKASADARWHKDKPPCDGNADADADGMRTHCEGNTHQTPVTSNHSSSLRSEEGATKRATRPKREDISLKTYLEACREAGKKPIPPDHPIRAYCADAGITDEMLQLAWIVFKDRFTTGKDKGKRQKDWPAHFANAVRGRWAALWYTDEKGETGWTSAGLQEKQAAEARLKPQHGGGHEPT